MMNNMDRKARQQELEESATAGLKRAQQFAWKRALDTGTAFIIWKDGEPIDLNPATNGGISYAKEVAQVESSLVGEDPAED